MSRAQALAAVGGLCREGFKHRGPAQTRRERTAEAMVSMASRARATMGRAMTAAGGSGMGPRGSSRRPPPFLAMIPVFRPLPMPKTSRKIASAEEAGRSTAPTDTARHEHISKQQTAILRVVNRSGRGGG